MKRQILFVCTGNVCRSPMAAALFQDAAQRAGDAEKFVVSSAGTWALEGQPASAHAQTMMQQRGLDISPHRGRTVTHEIMQEADLILVMARNHKDSLSAEFPFARKKIHLLSELVGQQYDIADPYGKAIEDYEATVSELSQLIDKGYPRIAEWLDTKLTAQSASS